MIPLVGIILIRFWTLSGSVLDGVPGLLVFFSNAKSSIILNGNLTDEFHLHRGLHHANPLSPISFYY